MNDFQVVQYKRKGRRSHNSAKHIHPLDFVSGYEFNKDICEDQINTCKSEIIASKFWKDFYSLLLHTSCCEGKLCENYRSLEALPYEEIIVYGIGSLCSSSIARYQFAFVQILTKRIGVKCFIYDPVLTYNEKLMIEGYGIYLIEENEECKRRVHKNTLFIMLHCGKPMYNNLLWSNWGLSLENVFLIGNCFSSYKDRILTRELAESAKYLNDIIPFTLEHTITNSFHHDDIFNDTAIHTFPKKYLLKVPSEMWSDNSEPSDCHDNEIITNK